MKTNEIIYYASCGIEAGIKGDQEKWQVIRDLYPNSIIVKPDRDISFLKNLMIITECDFVVASEIAGAVSADVNFDIKHALRLYIPVYVIRKKSKEWRFHRVKEVKQYSRIDNNSLNSKLVLERPNADEIAKIDRNLLSSPEDIFGLIPENQKS